MLEPNFSFVEWSIEYGTILKKLRKAKNLTQKEVGESIGRAHTTVATWESGHAQPPADMLFALCQLYDVKDVMATFGIGSNKPIHSTRTTENDDDLSIDTAWFRFSAKAKAEGVAIEDLELALDFIRRSRESLSNHEAE